MSHHAAHSDAPGTVERRPDHRRTDVVVVGGSAAGLAAALQLVRQRRSVIVVDSGEPRNAPAAHMHGYLGHEAVAPSELTAIGREEVRSYGGEVLAGRVMNVSRDDDEFRLAVPRCPRCRGHEHTERIKPTADRHWWCGACNVAFSGSPDEVAAEARARADLDTHRDRAVARRAG